MTTGRLLPLLLLCVPVLVACQPEKPLSVPDDELQQIATLIYRNECGGQSRNLTSWNRGEAFASLGIGHFIWYPEGTPASQRPFRESFPELLAYLQQQGATPPAWLRTATGAPWPDRHHFMASIATPRIHSLRQFLQTTMSLQADFMLRRMQRALPVMQQGLDADQQQHIRRQFRRVAASPMGAYALIDYVNFKGEGVRASERYRGKGWGLRQVLLGMRGERSGIDAIRAFSESAGRVLERRVHLSPAERHEARWLPGWDKRVRSYIQEAEAFRDGHRTGTAG